MNHIDITKVINEEFQKKIQSSFAYSTGYGIVFVDKDGNHIGESCNFTDFCSAVNATDAGRKACALSNKQGLDEALRTKSPCIYICHANLINIVIPFLNEGEYMGALTAGQVKCTDKKQFMICEENLLEQWLADETLRSHYESIRTFENKRIEVMTKSLADIQDYIFQTYIANEMRYCLAEKEREVILYKKRQLELKHQLKITELEMLQKKIVPHFMFNVINSISRLISLEENEKALNMTNAFANMMRYTATTTKLMVPLEQELEYLKNYLAIQAIRFEGKVKYKIHCDEELKTFQIPFFSLQPFVENSLEHGILNSPNEGAIIIRCAKNEGAVILQVQDTGLGISETVLCAIKQSISEENKTNSGEHIGIFNCYNRYKIVFENRFDFAIDSAPNKGTMVTVKIRQ